ncbi:MAG: hypothetical protein Q8L86_21245 [Vicinamibacterales bacterium]|nr:hypothetical protein [Vicinamibacterales bacterium]
MPSRHRCVFGVGVLLSVLGAGCSPGAGVPDSRGLEEAARAVAAVEGPAALVLDTPDPATPQGTAWPPGTEFVALEAAQIERVRDSHTVVAAEGLRTALELRGYWLTPLPGVTGWVQLQGRMHCATVRTTSWSPLPGLEYSGRIGISIPGGAGGEFVLIAGDHGPLALSAEGPDGGEITLAVEPLQNAPGTNMPPADFWLERGDPGAAPAEVVRVRLPAGVEGPRLVGIRFGRRAPQVLARLAGYDGDVRARVCAAPLGGDDGLRAERPSLTIDHPASFGAGWSGEGRVGADTVRWTGREAALLVPSGVSGAVHLELEALPPAPATGAAVVAVVNGVALPAQTLDAPLRTYAWAVPAGVWLAGTNEILLRVSEVARNAGPGRRDVGLGVRAVRVHLAPP